MSNKFYIRGVGLVGVTKVLQTIAAMKRCEVALAVKTPYTDVTGACGSIFLPKGMEVSLADLNGYFYGSHDQEGQPTQELVTAFVEARFWL
jgi:hypothetical protein